MRKFLVIGVVAAMCVAVLAVPASAGQVHKVTEKFTDSHDEVIPAGVICEFSVGVQEEVKGSETLWFDADDNLLKVHVKVNGTSIWSGPGGSATEHWAWSGWFDPVEMTFAQSGNVWNVHQNGLVIHDKGLIVFDDTTGEAIKISGPHEVWNNGLGALCEAIG